MNIILSVSIVQPFPRSLWNLSFGYASGAFTGASRHGKVGKFEFADHGSIFLDEINLLPKAMQPKFLRVLQEREIEPVGSDKNISIDVRIIAATNRPLDIDVKEGTFRLDLYYRLNVIRIIAPPLRERIHRYSPSCGLFYSKI